MSLELEDGSVDEGLFKKVGGVVGSEAGGEIVGAIEDGIIGGEEIETVFGFKATRMEDDLDVGIDLAEAGFRAFEFRGANTFGVVENLAVEIGEIDLVGIDETDFTNACCCEIEDGGRAKATSSDAKD